MVSTFAFLFVRRVLELGALAALDEAPRGRRICARVGQGGRRQHIDDNRQWGVPEGYLREIREPKRL